MHFIASKSSEKCRMAQFRPTNGWIPSCLCHVHKVSPFYSMLTRETLINWTYQMQLISWSLGRPSFFLQKNLEHIWQIWKNSLLFLLHHDRTHTRHTTQRRREQCKESKLRANRSRWKKRTRTDPFSPLSIHYATTRERKGSLSDLCDQ